MQEIQVQLTGPTEAWHTEKTGLHQCAGQLGWEQMESIPSCVVEGLLIHYVSCSCDN